MNENVNNSAEKVNPVIDISFNFSFVIHWV